MAKIYPNIKAIREDKDITQKELAAVLGVSQNTYSQYENGVIALTAENLERLADYYQTSTDYLLGRTTAQAPFPHDSKCT